MTVNIHGNEYVTVAERLEMAKNDISSINTEILYIEPNVVVKATVTTKKGTFTGISGANPNKAIEKLTPYEVAETSAVGRALGFAGYGAIESIATAEEMIKAGATSAPKSGPPITQKQIGFLHQLLVRKGCAKEQLYKKYNITSTKELTIPQATEIIGNLMKLDEVEVIEDFGENVSPEEIK